jgi:hypothetical protein
MHRAGLPELETVDFEPLTRRDSAGKEHTFHFVVHMSTGLGIKAFELVDGVPGGYQFFVLEPPHTAVRVAYDKLVKRIEAGLAVRYLRSSDFPGSGASQNRLYVKGTAVNGRIDEGVDPSILAAVGGVGVARWSRYSGNLRRNVLKRGSHSSERRREEARSISQTI